MNAEDGKRILTLFGAFQGNEPCRDCGKKIWFVCREVKGKKMYFPYDDDLQEHRQTCRGRDRDYAPRKQEAPF